MDEIGFTTAVKILSETGNINRFSNADKLAQFAGIVPLKLSSAGKGKDRASKQGNRRLQATIYFLAIQMVQISSKGTPRNSAFRAYYERLTAEGKNVEDCNLEEWQIDLKMLREFTPEISWNVSLHAVNTENMSLNDLYFAI